MKKSNKLLLGGFLAGLLLITAIHVTLYAKYKKGDYTIYKPEEGLTSQSMLPFPNVLFVSVSNLPNATVKFSDTARVEKGEEGDIRCVQKGDTLLITGNDELNRRDAAYPVLLNLPYNTMLSVFNSSLTFPKGNETVENNPVIHLRKSKTLFLGANSPLRFGHMKVTASDSSTVAFHDDTQINKLDVRLFKSSIEYTGGNVGQLSIETDSVSRISLQSRLLAKATIKTITPE